VAPALAIAVTTCAPQRAEHAHLAHIDLDAIAGLTLLVLPLPILDTALDVDLVALFHITLDDVGELRRLRVPHHAPVPFRFLLLRTSRVIPRAACGERERRDAISSGCRSYLGI